ncbi:WD-40 repeat-containing protein MSI4-like [Vigna radiata var. radiata]|uniref:WD-40 repeat-containing protein MSI4-like n=1 Tax=Vigna radiata var. radiata TaxID=3916 RepID=A0A3Q0EP31_VIGRR|nr:WD-40 repeat-containing protein MSI4-like [Vigna radiata var. radiata]
MIWSSSVDSVVSSHFLLLFRFSTVGLPTTTSYGLLFLADGVLNWNKQLTRIVTVSISLSEQTDESVPNTLVIANCDVVKPRVVAVEHISQFNEESQSPFVKKFKTILHPGEGVKIYSLRF